MDRAKLDTLILMVNRLLGPAGYECIEAEWAASDRILRLYVDTLAGAEAASAGAPGAAGEGATAGITLDGCVKVSRLLEDVSELEDIMPGRFTLEVSSPGVERPLRQRRHFERHIGDTVQVRLSGKVQERRNGVGRLIQVAKGPKSTDDGAATDGDTLITLETEQGAWSFPLASLQRASLVYDWGNA